MTTDTRQTATHPTGADLKPFGYAPGGYMVRCRHCDAIRADLDKRAWSCRSCAVEQWQARQSAPPTQTAQPLPAAIETDIGDLLSLCKPSEVATAWGIAASLRTAITTAISSARQDGWLAGREAAAKAAWDFVSEKRVPTASDIRAGIAAAIRQLQGDRQ